MADPTAATNTLHMLGSLKDMCADFSSLYGRFWRQVLDELEEARRQRRAPAAR